MTISDKWLIELARRRKAEAQHAKEGLSSARPSPLPPIDDLWTQLQREVQRQATLYTDTLGDPGALVVETTADAIDVRGGGGRQLTLRVDREEKTMWQTLRSPNGAVRTRRPIIAFSRNAAGELTFNWGTVQSAAGSILKRVIR